MLSVTGPSAHSCLHDRTDGGCAACKVRLLSVCAALTGEELDDLEALSQPLHLAPHQPLFRQGDPADAVYNVTEGTVRLSRLLPDGRRHVMGFAMVGDFLGLALPERYTVTAEALGHHPVPVREARLRRSRGGQAPSSPASARAGRLRTHPGAGPHDPAQPPHREEKVASFLLALRERYARIGQTSVTLVLPMGRQDIADHLGLTIETVSRLLTRLDREKALLIVPGGCASSMPAGWSASPPPEDGLTVRASSDRR